MDRLRLGTLNLRDLQLADQPIHPGVRPLSRSEYAEKVEWLGGLVRRLDADVLALSELWTPQAFVDVVDAAGIRGEVELVTTAPVDRVGVRTSVALLVRSPWTVRAHEWIRALPTGLVLSKRPRDGATSDETMSVDVPNFARPVLRVVVERPGFPAITVFAVHLKSRRPVDLDPEDAVVPAAARHATALGQAMTAVRRAVEAVGLRVLVERWARANPGPVVVAGDLNGPLGSETLGGDLGRGRALGLNATVRLAEPGTTSEGPFTYVNQGTPIVLDHVLVSDEFLARPFAFAGLEVDHAHLERFDEPLPRTVTDHGGVVAAFDLLE